MTIINFNPNANRDAVEVLEAALKRVKSGDIKSVSVSWITKNDTVCGDISSGDNQLLMLASMENTLWSFKGMVFEDEDR